MNFDTVSCYINTVTMLKTLKVRNKNAKISVKKVLFEKKN